MTKNDSILSTLIPGLFLITLFIVLLTFVSKELEISHLEKILPFVPNYISTIIGILLIVFFIIIFLKGVTDIQKGFGYSKRLIVTGIFKYIRNPIFSSIGFTILGFGFFLKMTGVFFTGLLWMGLSYNQAKKEEKELSHTYGQTYIFYKKHTPMLFPNIVLMIQDFLKNNR